MWIPRELAEELPRLAASFPVVVLTGPRQVGKTALLERTFPAYRFVPLDAGQNAEAAETRPEEFLDLHPPPAILDEMQYAPGLLRHLKARVDRHRGTGQYLLTGSQTFPLMQSVSESLAGRAAVVPMLGLSAAEWSAVGSPGGRDSMEFLWRGSFPALWASEEAAPPRDRWYQGYVATYLERDVRNLLFWQDRTGREVDLLLETDQRLVPVECKWTERPGPGDTAGIRRLRALYGDAVTDAYVACTTSGAVATPVLSSADSPAAAPAGSGALQRTSSTTPCVPSNRPTGKPASSACGAPRQQQPSSSKRGSNTRTPCASSSLHCTAPTSPAPPESTRSTDGP